MAHWTTLELIQFGAGCLIGNYIGMYIGYKIAAWSDKRKMKKFSAKLNNKGLTFGSKSPII